MKLLRDPGKIHHDVDKTISRCRTKILARKISQPRDEKYFPQYSEQNTFISRKICNFATRKTIKNMLQPNTNISSKYRQETQYRYVKNSGFIALTSAGKERGSETGFSYFGARYYDSDLMTGWLSVDYKADNLVKLVDTDGEKLRYTAVTSQGFKKKFIACVLFGIIYTFFPINVISQNDSIQRIVVKYIEMNDLYPIRIDNAMFEQINPNQFECVLENDCLKLFQNNLNNLKQADPEFQKIDIRRKIEITYFSGKIVELYIDRFHILYNGIIFISEGELRNMIESLITKSLKQ